MNDVENDDASCPNWETLKFQLAFSQRYHGRREQFLDFWDKAAKAFAVIGGAATIAESVGAARPWIAVAICVTSGLSLVFSLSQRARQHADYRKRYGQLEVQLMRVPESDFESLRTIAQEIAAIESEEPPCLPALVQMSQNDVAVAERKFDDVHPLPFWKRCTAQVFSWAAQAKPQSPA